MRITTYTLWLLLFVVFNATAQQFQESDIWLADIRIKPGSVYFGSIQNIINTKGYDNQPCFIDDTILLYTHIGDDGQADIYSYHTLRKMITKFADFTGLPLKNCALFRLSKEPCPDDTA